MQRNNCSDRQRIKIERIAYTALTALSGGSCVFSGLGTIISEGGALGEVPQTFCNRF